MKKLALFDLDQTLIPIDSDYAWGRFIMEEGIISNKQFQYTYQKFYNDYTLGCLDINSYLYESLKLLSRYSRCELNKLHKRFMDKVILPCILPSARQLVNNHLKAGDLCCIVTATNVFITKPIAKVFGIKNLIGVELATENHLKNSRYTGKVQGIPSFQFGKIIRIQSWLKTLGLNLSKFEKSFFYSDSHNDIPLLKRVNTPVATNPDHILFKYASDLGWPIIKLFDSN